MLNLLRMDLYRLMRSKAFYICLGFLLTTVFLCYGMLFLVGTPKGQETAPKIGMGALVETGGDTSIRGSDESAFSPYGALWRVERHPVLSIMGLAD